MLNLVEKYTAEAAAETEDGVVAIEYVLMAALVAVVVVGLGLAFDGLGDRLEDVIDTVIA
jgi:Flp pilus assembly pilin Flp